MTQSQVILEHLKKHGSITQKEAIDNYGIMRLGARIWDLKRGGHNITSERETGVNRYNEKTHYAKYYLRKGE